MDRETLEFYSRQASDYAEFVGDAENTAELDQFIGQLAPGARALDFGCGHGWAAKQMKDAGLDVTAIDGSVGLAQQAKSRYGIEVEVMTFDTFEASSEFDGLWVCFSLLHDTRDAMPGHIARLRRAARPGALLYLGLKEGDGEQRDAKGRRYSYFSEAELVSTLEANLWGEVAVSRKLQLGMAGEDEPCLHIFARAI